MLRLNRLAVSNFDELIMNIKNYLNALMKDIYCKSEFEFSEQ